MRLVYIVLSYLIDGVFFSNSLIPFMMQKHKNDIEITWNVYNNIDECDVENITSCAYACK